MPSRSVCLRVSGAVAPSAPTLLRRTLPRGLSGSDRACAAATRKAMGRTARKACGTGFSIGPVALVEIDLLRRELKADDDRVVARRGGRRERDAQLELVVDRRHIFVREIELTGEDRLVDDVLRAIGDGDEIGRICLRRAGAGPAPPAAERDHRIDGAAGRVLFPAPLHAIPPRHHTHIPTRTPGPPPTT